MVRAKLITVVCGNEMEERVLRDLEAAGVKGYTVMRVSGRGMHGVRKPRIDDAANIRIDIVLDPGAMAPVTAALGRYRDEPLTAYIQDVETFLR